MCVISRRQTGLRVWAAPLLGVSLPPLPQLPGKILEGKPGQSVNELTEAALAAGYGSKAKSFKSIVRQTLYHDKRFRRVGRGKFALKG
jgi:hypothetical protein